MNANPVSLIGPQHASLTAQSRSPVLPRDPGQNPARDILELGSKPPTPLQSSNIVLERAFEKLRAVVGNARAELGIPEGTVLDTSPEATANRIVDFALGAFESYWGNHDDLNQDDARAAFADFIGKAINQGIEEARDILTALNALNPEVGGNIDTISSLIQERLDAFVTGG